MKIRQIWAWTRFTLQEYLRSGRILIELLALMIFSYIFLRRPNTQAIITATQYFSMTAVFVLAQTVYTMAMLVGMGQRAQGYVVLARSLGRRGYLLGLFFTAILISIVNFVLTSIIVTVINHPAIWTMLIWGAGALPLIMDILLVAALVLLLSSLVLSDGWRLVILGIVALGSISSADWLGPALAQNSLPGRLLASIRTLVAAPLLPLLSGFELATQRIYTQEAVLILVGQFGLMLALLLLAFAAFDRRNIILV